MSLAVAPQLLLRQDFKLTSAHTFLKIFAIKLANLTEFPFFWVSVVFLFLVLLLFSWLFLVMQLCCVVIEMRISARLNIIVIFFPDESFISVLT